MVPPQTPESRRRRDGDRRQRVLRTIAKTVVAGLWLLVAAALLWLLGGFFYPGITPSQTARILVEDRKFGGRALGMAKFWGDRLIEPLREASADFRSLDGRNAFWIAEYLAANPSPRSIALAAELHERAEPLSMLVGAIGLAAHGSLPDSVWLPGGRLQRILGDESQIRAIDDQGRATTALDTDRIELALIAARHARSALPAPDIVRILAMRPAGYWVHAKAAEALGAIGDPRTADALADALSASDFHALPEAFLALHALGDPRAVPLAIERVDPKLKGTASGQLVDALSETTGLRCGYDRECWKTAWKRGKSGK